MVQKTIGLIGAGNMGAGILARLSQAGHRLLVSDHDPVRAAGVVRDATTGQPGTAEIAEEAEVLAQEIVILALWYPGTLEFAKAHAEALAGRIVVDIAIPLNSTYTRLSIPADTSAAEALAALLPDSQVVKAFNTIPAATLKTGHIDGIDIDTFVAGDSADAKSTVLSLLDGSGLRGLDAGALDNSRLLERLTAFGIELGQIHGVGFDFGWKYLPTVLTSSGEQKGA